MAVLGLTLKDAKTLVSLDSGERLDYYDEVLDGLGCSMDNIERAICEDPLDMEEQNLPSTPLRKRGRIVANWFDFPS